jgi:predicted RNase H-like HicB family nuclease
LVQWLLGVHHTHDAEPRAHQAIETGDAKHVFGVVVPDLPGCFSAGDTLDDALINSREAILLHL